MRYFLLSLLLSAPLYADKVLPENALPGDLPWITGPLLTPTSLVVPPGHFNLEPYLYATSETGFYNRHWHAESVSTFFELTSQNWIEVGITPWMDCQIVPTFSYQQHKGSAEWVWNDLEILVDFQLYPGSFPPNNSLRPAVKLTLSEIFPTGKHDQLSQSKHYTDQGGAGSFQSAIGITIGQLFQIQSESYYDIRCNLNYTIPSAVHVRGFNTYGGDAETDATVYPGQYITLLIGHEYTFNRHWGATCDLVGIWTSKTTYTGNTPLGLPSSTQYSIAPAIEYNFSSRLGIISGAWFTVAGRNSVQFYSGIFALNYYY